MAISKLRTGVGRIVWGHPLKAQDKTDPETNQPILRNGEKVQQWVFGVAFPKAEFERDIYPHLYQEAASGYPSGFPQKFAWKYKDGDGIDPDGKPFSQREGWAGCYVLSFTTEAFAPPVHKWEGDGYRQLTAEEIKCGDFVIVNFDAKVNIPTNRMHTPGLYINPNGVEFVAYGQEIITAKRANPNELFGDGSNRPVYQLPVGASVTPLAPPSGNVAAPMGAPHQMPGQPPMMQPMQQPQMAPAPQQQYQQQAASAQPLPPPAHGFAQQMGAPHQMPGQPPMGNPMPGQPPQYAAAPAMPGQPTMQQPGYPTAAPMPATISHGSGQ